MRGSSWPQCQCQGSVILVQCIAMEPLTKQTRSVTLVLVSGYWMLGLFNIDIDNTTPIFTIFGGSRKAAETRKHFCLHNTYTHLLCIHHRIGVNIKAPEL